MSFGTPWWWVLSYLKVLQITSNNFMKEKLISWTKTGLMWFGGFIVITFTLTAIFMPKGDAGVEAEKQAVAVPGPVEVASEQPAIQKPVEAKTNSIVTINSSELDYLSVPEVNVWVSYTDRTLVTKLQRNDKVELLDQDVENDYCQIKKSDKVGWINCGWISDLPK